MHFLSGFHAAPHRQNAEVDVDYLREQLRNTMRKPIVTDLKFQGRTIGGGSSLPRKPTTEAERIALETANQEFYNCLEQGYTKEQCNLVFAEAFKVLKNNEYGASGGGAASPQGEESSNTLLYVGAAAAVFAAVFLLRKRSKG
jgi:LPXTG-motif cell wall-anchored protein